MPAEIQRPHQSPHFFKQPLHIHSNAPRANLNHRKRRVPRFPDVLHTQDISVYRLEPRGQLVPCGRREVGRKGVTVADGGGEEREQRGDFVGGGFGFQHDAAKGVEPVEAGGIGGDGRVVLEERRVSEGSRREAEERGVVSDTVLRVSPPIRELGTTRKKDEYLLADILDDGVVLLFWKFSAKREFIVHHGRVLP